MNLDTLRGELRFYFMMVPGAGIEPSTFTCFRYTALGGPVQEC
jgi:hypothetical protein